MLRFQSALRLWSWSWKWNSLSLCAGSQSHKSWLHGDGTLEGTWLYSRLLVFPVHMSIVVYVSMQVISDFMQRIKHYSDVYQPLDEGLDRELSFIKIIDQGDRFYVNRLRGVPHLSYLLRRRVHVLVATALTRLLAMRSFPLDSVSLPRLPLPLPQLIETSTPRLSRFVSVLIRRVIN